ncbi:gibberellin-regulated protein 9-like isoform X1 [Ananas comosus]|uniref:Gibberellin-regulated protein 9-like isoform X1 n=1 Tax=Ananas comosus TaxID=4615 RepID=A0A6P5GH25_ANACO|nr:gibberellin-regulated protein 9-like isoform X1 [Ananas comosus]
MDSGRNKKLVSWFIVLFLFMQVVAEASLHNFIGLEDDKEGNATPADGFSRRPIINCNFACARRCMKASRKNVCARACGTCCIKCQCVPAGTSGNKTMCPCYANLRTHGLKPKCP